VDKPGERDAGKIKNIRFYRFFHISIEILIFVVLVVFTTLLLRPLQETIRKNMEDLRDTLITRIESLLDRKIQYASIGPSIFGTLDIRNIQILGDGAQPVISVSRLRISYSLWNLIRGGKAGAFRSIRIDRPIVTLDTEQDADLLRLLSSFQETRESPDYSPSPGIADFFPENLRFRIRGGEWVLRNGPGLGYFHLDGLSFDAVIADGHIQFGGRWNAEAALVFNQPITVSMPGRMNGECSLDLDSGTARVVIPSFSGDRFRFQPVTVNFTLRDQKITVQKIDDRAPFDLSLDYDLNSGDMSGSFRCENFVPRNLISLTGPWRDYAQWFSMSTTGEASFERDKARGLRYFVDFFGALPKNLPLGNASFVITGRGDQDYINFDRIALKLPQGDLRYTGGCGLKPFAPNGNISLSGLSFSGNERINAELNVTTEGRKIGFFGEGLSLGEVLLSALEGTITMEEEGFTFAVSALCFRDIESYEDVRLSSLSFEGSMDFQPRHIRGNMTLDSFALLDAVDMVRPFAALAPVPVPARGILGDLGITTEVFITTDLEHISYNIPRFIIAYEGEGDVYALASISGTDQYFELNEIRIVRGEESVEVLGYADFSNPMDIYFSMTASYRELSYYFEGSILDGRSLSVQGSYGLNVYIGMADLGVYSGHIEVQELPIPFNGQYAHFNLLSSLYYTSPSFWSFDITQLEITDLKTPASPLTALRISGQIDQDGALFSEFFFDDQMGALRGRAAASWGAAFTNPHLQVNIADEQAFETYDLEGNYQDKILSLDISVSRMQFARFFQNSYNAVASGKTRLAWNTNVEDSFSLEIDLETFNAQTADTLISGSTWAFLKPEECIIRGLRMSYAALSVEVPFLRIDRLNSRAETGLRLMGTLGDIDMDIALDLGLNFKPVNSWLKIAEALNSFQGVMKVSSVHLDTLSADSPFEFAFSRTDKLLTLSGGPEDMFRLRISDEGNFYAGLSYPAPVRGAITGTINSRTIDAQGNDLYIDLADLWRFIPARVKNIIDLAGGFVTASVRIAGPLGDPEFFGTARGHSVQMLVPQYVAAPIRPVPVVVTLDGNEMTFGPIPARVGNGGGIVSGWFQFDRWVPNTFNLDIKVLQEDPIPFNMNVMGILARGDVSGTLRMSMADYIFTVSGDLTAQDTEISLDTNELFAERSLTPATQVSTAADITITSGRKVEFVWPVTEFPLLQAYADLGTVLNISSDNLSGRFSVTGDINLRGGEIFYAERSFYIREGTLSFNENEIQFDPRISARAEIRDRIDSGPVTISMIIDNAPLRSFSPRLESNPPLSQIEILSLLGQNLTGAPEESTGAVQRAFLNSTADVLAQFSVVRRMERKIRDFLSLDLFSVRTQVLQNAVIQATGLQGPVDRMGGVGNYFDNTTVFLGKYFGADMFAQGMLSFRYDENKTTSGWLTYGGLTLEPDIGIELRSPLFTIRWNVLLLHPENLFINDNSFTVTWRWSF
jgi:hypothetical protein